MNEEHLISNNGDYLYTRLFCNGGKEAIIVLHGGPGVPNEMELVTQTLSKTHQVIVFHQRGTKKSICNTKDYSMVAYISDINAIANYFCIDKFHLFGHSWGGLYAQLYAQQYPKRILSLFLSCSIGGTGRHYVEASKEIQRFNVSKINIPILLKLSWYSIFAKLGNDKAYQKILKVILTNYNEGFNIDPRYRANVKNVRAEAINRTRKEIVNYSALNDVFENQYKVTIIYGDEDVFTNSKVYTMNRFPSANKFTIPKCGHNPWLHNFVDFENILSQHY